MTKFIMAAVASVLLAAPAAAQEGPRAHPGDSIGRAQMEARIRQAFERADTNRDGYVTRDEAQAFRATLGERGNGPRQARRQALFDRLDANRDGAISREEFNARPAFAHGERAARGERGAERRAHRGGGRGGFGPQAFERLDADNDQRISLAEALNARRQAAERRSRAD